MRRLGPVAFALALGLVLGASSSCDDQPTPQPCTAIPAGGCPLSHGVACEDPSCVAVYRCREGDVWELDHVCPARPDAGAPDATPPADASVDRVQDAAIDAPEGAFGGPGCGPLQQPDCSAGFALSCPSGCCDCEDLFVCRNGGWEHWGTCGDGGIRTP
jgi:hypothetical protein